MSSDIFPMLNILLILTQTMSFIIALFTIKTDYHAMKTVAKGLFS